MEQGVKDGCVISLSNLIKRDECEKFHYLIMVLTNYDICCTRAGEIRRA